MSTVIVESLTSPAGRVVNTDNIAVYAPKLASELPSLTMVGEHAYLYDYGQTAWYRGNGAWTTNEKYVAADQLLDYDFMTHQYKKMESYGIVPSTLATAISTTRSGVALYSSVYDGLESASANTSRIEYSHQTGISGLLCEPAATNMVLQSNDASNAAWGKLSLLESSPSSVIAPDGVSVSTLIREDVSNTAHHVHQTVTAANSNLYGLSAYAKPNAGNHIILQFIDTATYTRAVSAIFDLSTGEIVSGVISAGAITQQGASIEKAANGWYRVSVWAILGGAGTAVQTRVGLSNGISQNYAGDGNRSINIWGTQFELKGQGSTSLVQTAGSQASRSADVIHIDTPYANPEQCTLYFDFTLESYDFASGNQAVLFKIADAANTVQRGFGLTIDAGAFVCRLRESVSNSISSGVAAELNRRTKIAISYKANGSGSITIGISVNGSTPAYSLSVNSMEGFTGRLHVNGASTISGTLTTHAKIVHRVRAFSRALSEYELRLLTA